MTDCTLINVSNDFYKNKLQLVIKELKKGNAVEPIVDCIGFTRNNMVQEKYKDALIKYFGEELNIECHSGICCYSYIYKLTN